MVASERTDSQHHLQQAQVKNEGRWWRELTRMPDAAVEQESAASLDGHLDMIRHRLLWQSCCAVRRTLLVVALGVRAETTGKQLPSNL